MMKKLLTLILLVTQLSFSQTEKDDYELYTLILSEQKEFVINKKIDSIILIEQFENKFDIADYELFDYKIDSVYSSDINFLSANGVSESFIEQLISNPKLRKAIKDLTSDFDTQPKIKSKLLSTQNLKIKSITAEKYYSFFGKKGWKKNAWKRIKRKYGVDIIIEFSKVSYNGKFATTYFGIHCGGLCGMGYFYIFEKIDGKWKTIASIKLWES